MVLVAGLKSQYFEILSSFGPDGSRNFFLILTLDKNGVKLSLLCRKLM